MSNDFEIQDDLNVTEESYPQQETGFKPPLPGTYRIKPLTWEFAKTSSGDVVKWKNSQGVPTYPVINLNMIEITEPSEQARRAGIFQGVPTSVFQREEKSASRAADLLRAIDKTATATNTGEVIRELTERLSNQLEFVARLDYTAYDADYVKEQFAAQGGKENMTQTQINQVYNRARIQGYRKIEQSNLKAGHGNLPRHKWVGPSGAVIDVKAALTVFYPQDSDSTPKLGPDSALVPTA